MAVSVKSVTESAQLWSERAGGASGLYASRAVAAADDWVNNAARSSEVFRRAMQAGNIAARFAAGIRKAGATKYRDRVQQLGASRYAEGVAVATDDYSTNVQPFLARIASLTLSPRQPRGSDANYNRVKEVGTALSQLRIARLGGGNA